MRTILSETKKKNLSVFPHPAAKSAYDFFHAQQYRFDSSKLKREQIKKLKN
ncbi:hypothetical protein ACFFUS_10490 [Vibrio gallaecicus]|uniref:hypothetical protein n=1 Tax=Vibrio gallaecicus TaxID=552386 RepID=UPI00142D84E8|nr:hypothetical protein [Vibrio gallaecicus]MDN3616772.1 hypothetical protein [Vibrio gallaecicus]